MSTSKSPKSTLKREFFAFFGSLQLAIALLLTIAVASMIGTVLPQDQGPAVITTSSFNPALKSVLLAIQAYDVYHTFWFQFLLATLFLNLAVCTYLRFPPTWRRFQMAMPPAPPLSALKEVVPLGAAPDEARLDVLRKRGYRVQQQAEDIVFAEKHKFVRLGPTFIHISLFAIIIGAIIGGLFGTKNSLPVQLGETLNSKSIYDTSYVKGPWSRPPAPFALRLDNFRMVFHPTGQVKQYYSRITVTPQGGKPMHERIWVNEPFVYGGQYFYQSFWGIGGFTYSLDGKPTRMAMTQLKAGGYVSRPFAIGDASYVLFAKALEQPALLISTKTFNPEAQVVPGIGVKLHGHLFRLETYHLFSGFQTKNDPGIPVVYWGCGVLIFGLALVPFSHREVWIRRGEQGWVLAGRTHKGRLMLRQEMEQIAAAWGTEIPDSPQPAEIGASLT